METNEILTALANLESSLKEINTAKKQVEETVTAYKSIYPHINAYVEELGEVSEKVLVLISEIKLNANNLNDTSKQILFNLSDESKDISSKLNSSCITITENFKTHTNNAIFDLKEALDKTSAEIDTYVIKLQNCINELSALGKDIKNATELVLELKKDVCLLSKELKESQNEQDEQLLKLIDNHKISSNEQSSELETVKLALSAIKTSQDNLNKVLTSQDEKIKQLIAIQKTNKTLTVVILTIVLIISIGICQFRYC